MHTDHELLNPYLPANWRWGRAGDVVSGSRPSRRRDDMWIHKAVRFRTDMKSCKKPADYRWLSATHGVVYWAHEMWRNREMTDFRKNMPYMIEARVLARQNDSEIAERTGSHPSVVEAYKAIFFDVAKKIDNPDYIYGNIIGPSLYTGFKQREYDILWKLYGYTAGPVVLDALIALCSQGSRPTDMAGVSAYFKDDVQRSMSRLTAMAGKMLTVNDHNATLILEQWHRMRETDVIGSQDGKNAIDANIQALMNTLQYTVGSTKEARVKIAAIAEFDNGAAELTGIELFHEALGSRVVDREQVHAMEFPVLAEKATTFEEVV